MILGAQTFLKIDLLVERGIANLTWFELSVIFDGSAFDFSILCLSILQSPFQ